MKNVPDEAYRKYKDFEDFIFQLFKVVGYEVKIDNTKKRNWYITNKTGMKDIFLKLSFLQRKIFQQLLFQMVLINYLIQ